MIEGLDSCKRCGFLGDMCYGSCGVAEAYKFGIEKGKNEAYEEIIGKMEQGSYTVYSKELAEQLRERING